MNRRFYAGRSGDGNWELFVCKVVIPLEARDLGFLLASDPSNRSHRASRDFGDEAKCLRLIPHSGEIIPLGIRPTWDSSHLGFVDSIKAVRWAQVQALNLLLPFDRIAQVFEAPEIDEPVDAALRRKTGSQIQLAFTNSSPNAVCHSRINSLCCIGHGGRRNSVLFPHPEIPAKLSSRAKRGILFLALQRKLLPCKQTPRPLASFGMTDFKNRPSAWLRWGP